MTIPAVGTPPGVAGVPLDTQQRIRSEEIFRLQVRAELLAASSPGKKGIQRLLAFLNTNFGLWMLSTVVIGGLSLLWNFWINDRQQTENKRMAREAAELRAARINDEISFRISTAMSRLEALHIFVIGSGKGVSGDSLLAAMSPLRTSLRADDTIFNPEFQAWSGLALIGELERTMQTLARKKEKGELRQVRVTLVRQLQKLTRERARRTTNVKQVAGELLQASKKYPWGTSDPAVDCDVAEPFC